MGLDTNDSLRYDASLADGGELPGWIQFDRNTGKLQITDDAPKGTEPVKVKIVATDTKSNQVTVTVILKPKGVGKDMPKKPAVNKPQQPLADAMGKPGLSEQIQVAGDFNLKHAADRFLQALSASFTQPPRA